MNFPHLVIEARKIGEYTLVIYDWGKLTNFSNPRSWENVELFDSCGNKLWTVNGMDKSNFWHKDADTFSGSRVLDGKIQLISFSGNAYDLSIETGEVKYNSFIK